MPSTETHHTDPNIILSNLRALLPNKRKAIAYIRNRTTGPLPTLVREYMRQHDLHAWGVWTPSGWRPKLVLRDYDTELVFLLTSLFGPYRGVSFGTGDLLCAPIDAIVCPVDSHISPSGSLFIACLNAFGKHTATRLRNIAAGRYHDGTLPVGQSISISVQHPNIHTLIAVCTHHNLSTTHAFMNTNTSASTLQPSTLTSCLSNILSQTILKTPTPITQLGLSALSPPTSILTREAIAQRTFQAAQRILNLQPFPERDE